MSKILIFAESEKRRTIFRRMLPSHIKHVSVVATEHDMVEQLLEVDFRALVFGCDSTAEVSTIALVQKLCPHLPIVVVTRNTGLEFERELRKKKVFFMAVEPLNPDEFHAIVNNAVAYSANTLKPKS